MPNFRKYLNQRDNYWLGREGSNLRMAESKSAALPLGYAPIGPIGNGTAPQPANSLGHAGL